MVTIELNGYIITGETLKEAQRLARKEEKRQKEEEKRQDFNRSRAQDMAFASLGRIAYLIEKNPRALASDLPHRHETPSDNEGYSLYQIEGRGVGPVGLYKSHLPDSLHRVLVDTMDRVVAVLIAWGPSPNYVSWYAIGTYGGETATAEIPSYLESYKG